MDFFAQLFTITYTTATETEDVPSVPVDGNGSCVVA